MSIVIMNMSQGNIEREEPHATRYADERSFLEQKPLLAMTQLVPEHKRRSFPADMAGVDLDSFLNRMQD